MAFDPSVIGSIGDSMPDFAGSKARGFQLKDMLDQQQLSQLKLAGAKQSQTDEATARGILSKSDISTDKGIAEASEKLNRAGLIDKAMGLRKYGQQVASGELDQQIQQLTLHGAAQDAIVGLIDPIVAQADAMKQAKNPNGTPKFTDAAINAWIQGQIPMALDGLKSSDLPEPVKNMALKAAAQVTAKSGSITYDQARAYEAQSKTGREQITSRLNELRATTTAAQETERERHDRATEDAATKRDARKQAVDEAGNITDDATDMAAQRLLNGEKASDVLSNFGRGKQGPQNIAKVQNKFAQLAKEQGMSPQDITNRRIEMTGELKEEQTAAAISGKIRYAENEIKRIAPKVLELSAQVPRGSFVPWNQLKLYGEAKLGDPKLKQLKAYLNTLVNSYDVLGGRGGTDVDKRAHNRELLDAADSPQALKAAVEAIQQEAELSGEAADESLRRGDKPLDASKPSVVPKENDPLGIR